MRGAETFNVVLMGDMTATGDLDLRIAGDVHFFSEQGCRIGLLHVGSRRAGARIGPEVERCVRHGLAIPVDPEWTVDTALLIIFTPHLMSLLQKNLRRVSARRTIIVADRIPEFDVSAKGRAASALFGDVSWAPTNRWVREAIEDRQSDVFLENDVWRAVDSGHSAAWTTRQVRPALGLAGFGILASDRLTDFSSAFGDAEVLCLGLSPAEQQSAPSGWTFFNYGAIAIDRYLSRVDLLAFFSEGIPPEMPDAIIAGAMANGKVVVVPKPFREHYGPGVLHCEPNQLASVVGRLLGETGELERVRNELSDAGRTALRQIREVRLKAVPYLVGDISREAGSTRPGHSRKSGRLHRALFVSPGETGYGEIEGMLAIAQAIEPSVDTIFATVEAAADTIEPFGFVAEHVTPLRQVRGDSSVSDAWHAAEVEQLIDAHDIDLLVLFGRNPSPGVVNAIARRGDCRLAWVRHAGQGDPPALTSVSLFDLVIEQKERVEIATEGPTTGRGKAVIVDPILVLDENEILSRQDAAATLGLDPEMPAALVGIDAQAFGDVWVVDKVMAALEQFPDIQAVIFEGGGLEQAAGLWPRALRARGRPLARYFRAFDFSIAAPGYGAFHESIALGLPSIFIPNGVDHDQARRADFAEAAGAGLRLQVDRFHELHQMIEVLLSEAARAHLRQNCRRIAGKNGALQAANALLDLMAPIRTAVAL